MGDLVEFGRFKQAPLYWQILSLDSKRIVLLSQEAVIAGAFQSDENRADANNYATSTVRDWLNTQFVPAAFGPDAESNRLLGRSSASDAIAGDIAYLLTARQLDRYVPEADDRVANSSAWAQANPGYGEVALAAGPVYWWLAPEPGAAADNILPVVQTNGAVNAHRYSAIASDGVRPAIRLNASVLKLTPVSGTEGVYTVTPK